MNKIMYHSITNLIVIPNIKSPIVNLSKVIAFLKFINLQLRNTQNLTIILT